MKVASNKIADIKSFIKKQLKGLYPDEEVNAFIFILFETYCGMNKTKLLASEHETINESELLRVYDAVKELEQQKPLQYIIGKTYFCGLEFLVTPAVLIPRPETEELVNMIVQENNHENALKILDIGTGSGSIAVALKKNLPGAEVTATDISESALAMAQRNASLNKVHIQFILSDILSEAHWKDLQEYDIIVSNPPYITESEKSLMNPNVLEYEPHTALFVTDSNPLNYYDAIFRFAISKKKGSKIYLEINENKSEELKLLAQQYHFSEVEIEQDINGKARFIKCRSC
ncbi:MAG TPA: peptide chain release factor N(5)-glutamine methyltransferase [Bacteroidales bacterium]|nr:peptide chain release factor N(5)-glutamine methyltransferase [Bacteroidales bacterium]